MAIGKLLNLIEAICADKQQLADEVKPLRGYTAAMVTDDSTNW